jgi:polyvinyl alcohol dehydrogenase (cytochrome)
VAVAAVAALAMLITVDVATLPASADQPDWPAYLHDAQHGSTTTDATVTSGNVGSLHRVWTWSPAPATKKGQPTATLVASPTVAGGRIYIGSLSGVFSAVDLATGHLIWSRLLGYVPFLTCDARGISSTATVAPDPQTSAPTVYVTAGTGYLYALDAQTGAIRWQSLIAKPSSKVNDYYTWSSPTVSNGSIYVGIASQCDAPLVQGGVKEYRQTDGTLLATYRSMPGTSKGATIWSSVVTDGTALWTTTGNTSGPAGDANSIVSLDPVTLARIDKWTVPGLGLLDLDFGASPTIFSATINGVATPMVGACSKNGVFYALQRNNLSAGPVWSRQIGKSNGPNNNFCDAAALWDGARLFVASNTTTIAGKTFPSSLRQLDPATGNVLWQRGVSAGPILGTPTLNGAGILAAGTFNTAHHNAVVLVSASTGQILRQLSMTSRVFGQPVFAGGKLLIAAETGGLSAWQP